MGDPKGRGVIHRISLLRANYIAPEHVRSNTKTFTSFAIGLRPSQR